MMETLQINLGPKKVYAITESGVSITSYKNSALPTVSQIAFENIRSDRFFHFQKSPLLLIAGAVFLLIYVFILADSLENHTHYYISNSGWALFGMVLLASYFVVRPKYFFIKTTTGKFIKFRVSKNEKEISSFVHSMIEKRNVYLKLKYGSPNSYLSYDCQFSNFNILLREGILTVDEYKKNIEILNGTFDQIGPGKIFSHYSEN